MPRQLQPQRIVAARFSLGELDELAHRCLRRHGIAAGSPAVTLFSHVEVEEPARQLRDQFEDWSKYRAERVARTEIIRSSNRANIESYRQAGVKYKVWMTSADCCDFCAPLEGKWIEIDEDFYSQGTTLEIEDADGKVQRMYLDYESVGSPPLHPNCRCAISPWFTD